MARIEITTEGLDRLAALEQLPEHSEGQFAEVTILRSLEEDVSVETDGFIQGVLPDSLQAEGNNALNTLLRRRHITLQAGFRNVPSATASKKKRSGPMSSMDFILGPDPDSSDDNTHEEEEKEEEPLGLAGDHFVDDLQDIDLRSGL